MESDTLRAEGCGPDSNSVVALDKEVPVILVVGRVRSPAEKRDALVALMEKMQDKSRREKGCIRYGFFAAVEDPLGFIAVEEWADREALDRHFAEPHLLEFASGLLELVSERSEVAIHEVAETSAFPGAS